MNKPFLHTVSSFTFLDRQLNQTVLLWWIVMTRVNSGCNMTKIQHLLSYFSTFPSAYEWKKSSYPIELMINDSLFIFRLQTLAWIEQHDILLCREILHIQPGFTSMAVLREVNCGMKLLLYWTLWKNLSLKSHLDLYVIDMACWLRNIKQNGMKRRNL